MWPWQRIADQIGSAATKVEGRQNMLCAYIAGALLLGLLRRVAEQLADDASPAGLEHACELAQRLVLATGSALARSSVARTSPA